MAFCDIFRIKKFKKQIADLETNNNALEKELDETNKILLNYTAKKELKRLIEVPRKIGSTVYVIMRQHLHSYYDCETIGLRRSDTTPENNIKIISITINHFVVQQSGVYIGFEEQYEEDKIYYINADSPNLFLTMDAAIAEMYSSSDKSKYKDDPFIILN